MTDTTTAVLAEAAKWLHAAYDRPPQTPECLAMLARVDKALAEPGGSLKNTGHGHVFPRTDGVKARCGGPGVCKQCSIDAARAKEGKA